MDSIFFPAPEILTGITTDPPHAPGHPPACGDGMNLLLELCTRSLYHAFVPIRWCRRSNAHPKKGHLQSRNQREVRIAYWLDRS